jgi:hypothetical protein
MQQNLVKVFYLALELTSVADGGKPNYLFKTLQASAVQSEHFLLKNIYKKESNASQYLHYITLPPKVTSFLSVLYQ